MALYGDRAHAGKVLAFALRDLTARDDVVVLALPRGGVPVAYEVATAIDAPLDVLIVRKLGVPGQREVSMGAIAAGGVCLLDEELVRAAGVSDRTLAAIIRSERHELARRERIYRGAWTAPSVRHRLCIVVDDGLATGATMHAAILGLRQRGADAIMVAVPVGTSAACRALERECDAVVCAAMPEPFRSVGEWYSDFSQTSDAQVRRLLEAAPHQTPISQYRQRVAPALGQHSQGARR